MSATMPADRSFHLIEAVPDRLEGAAVARRRRWSDAFKAEMVVRSFEPGTNVSALAREIGIKSSQLFGWRAEALKRGEVERRVDEAISAPACDPVARGLVEIVINGMTIRADADVGEAQLRRVIRAVRAA
ncbi:MAG: transposase [Nitrococcus sp.]|nr:transposase [Nitrococcus sp.]